MSWSTWREIGEGQAAKRQEGGGGMVDPEVFAHFLERQALPDARTQGVRRV